MKAAKILCFCTACRYIWMGVPRRPHTRMRLRCCPKCGNGMIKEDLTPDNLASINTKQKFDPVLDIHGGE